MALCKTITYKGFSIPDCYIKIVAFRGDKNLITFTVSHKKDTNTESLYNLEFECPHDLEAGNPLAQAYTFLKTIDQYQGAVDC